MTVQTSPNVDISLNSNGRISVLRNATVTWLRMLVVLHNFEGGKGAFHCKVYGHSVVICSSLI